MIVPMTSANRMAPTARAMPISAPRTLAVTTTAMILMAGPEYRKAIAAPRPAPRL